MGPLHLNSRVQKRLGVSRGRALQGGTPHQAQKASSPQTATSSAWISPDAPAVSALSDGRVGPPHEAARRISEGKQTKLPFPAPRRLCH